MGGRVRRRAVWISIVATALLALPAGAAHATASVVPQGAARTTLPTTLVARLQSGLAPLHATTAAGRVQAAAVPVLVGGTLSYPDPAFDADLASGDITNLAVTRTPQLTRFALSTREPHHHLASEQIIFWLDRDNDGTPERAVIATQDSSARMIAGVVSLTGTPRLLCSGATTGNPISVTVPTTCLGAMPALHVAASLHTGDVFGLPQDDDVPAAGLVGPVGAGSGTAGSIAYGGFVLTAAGDVQWFSLDRDRPAPGLSRFVAAELPGARAIAVGPDGANGYVMDGSGHMLPLGVGDDFGGATPVDGPQFPFDAGRALTIAPNGERGWVLDAYGGLHHFSIAQRHAAPTIIGAPYWYGWDIARSVALLPDGSGGWILDGFGGLHFFSIGTARTAPRILDAPFWPGWDVARSITVLSDGTGGWVVDAFGGNHFFSIGTRRSAPVVVGASYRTGGNLVAGTALVRSRPSLPAAAPPPGIPLTGARAVQFDASGTTVYASAGDLKVIDVPTERVVDAITVGTDPDAIAMAPDRKRLAVANVGSSDVSIVDLVTRRELRRITVPIMTPATLTLAYGSDGAVYVHGGSPDDTWRLDVASGAVTVVPALSGSGLLAGSGDGRRLVLVTLTTSGFVVRRFDLATGTVVKTRTLLTADTGIPNGLSVDGPGNRILLAPGGPVLDANLNTVTGSGSTGAPIAAVLDAWGVHRLRAIGQTVTMEAIDGSTSEQFALFGRLGTDMFAIHDDLAVTFDLRTIAVVTQTGVELVHR